MVTTINYRKFIEANFLIKNKKGQIVPFIFNETQNFYYDMMVKEYGGKLQGVRENILKFRQPGFSSLIDAIFTVDFIYSEWGKIPIIDADIVSHKEKDTVVLFNRVSGFLDSFFGKWKIDRKMFLETDSNTLIKGKRGAQIYVQTASAKVSGRGGALDDDTLVATINGFKRHGDLAIGDIIFDKYGKETKVIGTYPQGILDMYRVKLSTGVYLDAELNHLWEIRKNGKKEFVVNTQEIIDRFKDGFKTKIYGGDAVSYSEKKLLIEPYSLGVILGDGYICKDKYHKGYVSIITPELETLENMEKGLISKFERDIYKMSMYRYHNKNFKNGLVEYGLIYTKSHTKFIPKDYLESSIDQRKSLLAGLLDTDGYMDSTSNRIEYCTVSKQLADDVCLLVKSLGGNCHIGIAKKENHKGKIKLRHDLYRLNILVRFNPFTLTRKAVKWQEPQNKEWFRVVSVEKLNPKSCQCISVDSPTHTYRGGIGYMVTHNTKQNIHWSEVAFYPNTEILNANTLVVGAEQQVLDGVGKIFRETTGNTDIDFFAEEYYRGLEGLSEFKSRFLGWWLHQQYSKSPPVDWKMPPEYRKINKKYGATNAQCYWHWYKITKAKDPKLMLREYPIDENDAFIGDGTQYFDQMLTKYYSDKVKPPISSELIYV